MDGLLGRRRAIRAARTLPEVLSTVGLVDHHAHAILREPPASLEEFRGLFSESPDPRQRPHLASWLPYRQAIAELAEHLGCDATEQAVYERRQATEPDEYAASLMRVTGTEWVLVDDGYPAPGSGHGWEKMGELAGCPAAPVMRLERVAEEAGGDLDRLRDEVACARAGGFAALKTIAAYRGGLDLDLVPPVRDVVLASLEANEATGDPLPVQVHAGFGDSDLHLPRANPGYLKPVIERFRETPFVLLHCYPYVREAGWLAHVYGNVFFDLSLTLPHVGRPAEHVREALELGPVSKLLYASDAALTPELYFLAARRWREALAEAELSEEDCRAILRENGLALYRLAA